MRVRDEKGFSLVELLIVTGVIGIVAAIATPALLRARMSGNEASAIGSMRVISNSQTSYAAVCGQGGYATSLLILGVPCGGGGAGSAFISPDLAAAATIIKSGYSLTMSGNGVAGPADMNGTATNVDYLATAVPLTVGSSGQRGFNVSARSTIFVDPAGGAAGTTPLQ